MDEEGDDGIPPCKKKRLTNLPESTNGIVTFLGLEEHSVVDNVQDNHSPVHFLSAVDTQEYALDCDSLDNAVVNDTQEYILAGDTQDDMFVLNDNSNEVRSKQDNNNMKSNVTLRGKLKEDALTLLNDIFEDITGNKSVTNKGIGTVLASNRGETHIQTVENKVNKEDTKSVDINITKDIQLQRLIANERDILIDNKQCSINDMKSDELSVTSETQEYSLTPRDNCDKNVNNFGRSVTDQCKHQNEDVIILDDILADDTKNELTSIEKNKAGVYSGSSNTFNQNQTLEKNVSNGKEETGNVSVSSVKKTPSLARDAQIISSVVPNVNYNIIYNKLLENKDNANRLDIVTANLLENSGILENGLPTINNNQPTNSKSIVEDIELILKQYPTADPDLVQAFLASIENESDRVEKTIKEMGLKKEERIKIDESKGKPALLKKDSTIINDPVLARDPLFNDMRKVAKVFPNYDRNEIYAYLEAHINNPNRIQVVINELLRDVPKVNTGQNSNPNSFVESLPHDTPRTDNPPVIDLTDTSASTPMPSPMPSPAQEDVDHLQMLFPDCDPNYLFERIEAMKSVPDRRMVLAAELTDKKNYPKLKDRLEKEQLEENKKKQMKRNFTVEEFLNKFPEPQTTFGDMTKLLSKAYQAHATASILNDFLLFKQDYVLSTLREQNFHFYLTSKKLSDILVQTPVAERRLHRRFMKTRRKKMMPVPIEDDEFFFHEYWFTHNELNIQDYKKEKEMERQQKIEKARTKGELYECCCCFDDECLFEDLANCPEGHLFCKTCVIRSTEAAFGEMKNRFPCLTGECDQMIPLSTLQGIVPANMFSKIVSRLQEEEVLQAQIPDLVTCPFCPFATIMPDINDKVLKCLNPECLKESCRLCREESHIPLKCNEVESRDGVKMRTFIENRVAEAVMRKCNKCGKRFLKDSGCNKMTCVCGATSCYFCKEANIDYSHFERNKTCAQTNPEVIHDRDMKEAAKKAMEEYIKDHPEAAELDLQSDLKDIIKSRDKTTIDNFVDESLGADDDYDEPSSDPESWEYSDSDDSDMDEDGYVNIFF